MSKTASPKSAKHRLCKAFAPDDPRDTFPAPSSKLSRVDKQTLDQLDSQRTLLTIYAQLRNASNIEKWQMRFVRSDWRPTMRDLKREFGYQDRDRVAQALQRFAESLGTVTAVSPLNDFCVVETTFGQARRALSAKFVFGSQVGIILAPRSPLPRKLTGFVQAVNWETFDGNNIIMCGSLPSRYKVIPETLTVQEFTAKNPIEPLDYVRYEQAFPPKQQRNWFFGLTRAPETDTDAQIGLLFAGGYPDLKGLDLLQKNEFPETLDTQGKWSERVTVKQTTPSGALIPLPPEPTLDSETTADVEASMSSMVGGNALEVATGVVRGGTITLDVLLLLSPTGSLPMVWSSSIGSPANSPVFTRRFSQSFGLATLLGYTILVASGDQSVTNLNNGIFSDRDIEANFSAVTPSGHYVQSPSIIAVGAADNVSTAASPQMLLTPMNGLPSVANLNSMPQIFASSGGFSQVIRMAAWQHGAQKQWFETTSKGPSMGFDVCGRGFPDVVGRASFPLQMGDGKIQGGAGTSAAAPSFGGVLAAIEAQRRSKNLPPGMGPVHILFYENKHLTQKPFREGGANSMGPVQGFYTDSHIPWDPAAGLGVVWGDRLRDLVLGNESKNDKEKHRHCARGRARRSQRE